MPDELQELQENAEAGSEHESLAPVTVTMAILAVLVASLQNSDQVEKVKEKYAKEVERYRDDQKDIEAEAKKAQDDVKREGRRADRFDLGEVLLEAALVICSITLLTRKRIFWGLGLVLGLLGIAIGAAGFLVH